MISVIGCLIGLAVGMTGVGGGVFTAPILMLAVGMPPARSVGTALAFSTVIKTIAAVLFFGRKQVDLRVLAYMVAGGAPGALAGSMGLNWVQANTSTALILLLVGLTVAISAGISLVRPWKPSTRHAQRHHLLALFAFPIGLEVGFSSAGAGVLGTLALFSCTTLAPAAVVGTDLVFGLVISALGGGWHIAVGDWNRGVLLQLVAGGIPGVALGSFLSGRLPQRILRSVILAWAVLLGLILIYKGYTGI